MKIKDIMSKSVVSVNVNDTVENAATLMKQHNIGSVPVCSGNNISGIITDRDITLKSVASGKDTRTQSVKEVMTSNPITGYPEMSIDDASRIMSEQQIRRLPIVENNSLVGMVALGDLATSPKLQDAAEDTLSNISQPSTAEY